MTDSDRSHHTVAARVAELPATWRYLVALLAAAAAILLRVAFDPVWGIKLPYITLFPAIMLSAWFGGMWAGIVTTIVTGIAAVYFWIEPARSWKVADSSELIGLSVFLFVGIVISVLNEASRRGTMALAASEEREREARQEAESAAQREQAARADLERANRLKDDFLAVLSHELRTPLTAMLGYAHILNSRELPPDRIKHAVSAIERNALAQTRLVESLLDLSRILAGKLELDLQPLDLAEVVDSAVDAVRPDAETSGVGLEVTPPSSHVMLVADSGRLQQVFWNLLSNAIKFTPKGGRVTVRWEQRDNLAQIEIRDTGQGIAADFLPHVFDRFSQANVHARGSRSGLGLGLALVREMVHAHHGTVSVDSAGEGLGATFVVTLPVGADAWHGQAANSPVSELLDDSLQGLDILIVDDDGDARDLLTLLLDSRGAVTRGAASADEALAAVAERRPEVLVADIRMPGQDGYWLIRKVREAERLRGLDRLPAVAVTADAGHGNRERALAAGYDRHVAKPVDPDELAYAIARVVSTGKI